MAKKVDGNQAEIVEALRKVGCLVVDTHEIGRGVPDLLAYRPSTGRWLWLEVKSPAGTLTSSERVFAATWGNAVAVVRTAEEALRAIGVLERCCAFK